VPTAYNNFNREHQLLLALNTQVSNLTVSTKTTMSIYGSSTTEKPSTFTAASTSTSTTTTTFTATLTNTTTTTTTSTTQKTTNTTTMQPAVCFLYKQLGKHILTATCFI